MDKPHKDNQKFAEISSMFRIPNLYNELFSKKPVCYHHHNIRFSDLIHYLHISTCDMLVRE
jgi:hypothetical protein